MTECPRCADLEEQVAYWKSEAIAVFDETLWEKLKDTHGLRRMEARILGALAHGRSVQHEMLAEMVGCVSVETLKVHVVRIRKHIGPDAILTIWGRGYSIGDAGKDAIKAAREMAA